MLPSNDHLRQTNFVAFDDRFFNIVGPDAKVEKIMISDPEQSQEAPCYLEKTNQIFFAEWGYNHAWQYLLDADTNELMNVTTDPPTLNAHGCVYRDGYMYLATDGGNGVPASIIKVDVTTLKAETVINNFYQQPFSGFNDIDMDANGNLWVTDSISAWVRELWPRIGGLKSNKRLLGPLHDRLRSSSDHAGRLLHQHDRHERAMGIPD